jgi:hypothetical protein
MGKLLFVNTNRVNGIVGLVASLVFAGLGAAAIFTGSYLGWIGVALGLLLGKFCLKTATQRSELYEQGFVSKSIFGSQSGRYADLKSITRGAVRTNGVVTTRVHLVAQSGERLIVSREALGNGDKESQLLMDRACRSLSETWVKTLERNKEVVWLTKGSSPLLKIRKEGVLVEGASGTDGLIPLSQMRTQPRQTGLGVDILNGDRKIMTVNSGEPNYYVGLALIAMVLEKQTQSFAAGARG